MEATVFLGRKERRAGSKPAPPNVLTLPALQPLCPACLSPAWLVDLVTMQHMPGSLMGRVLHCSDVWGLLEKNLLSLKYEAGFLPSRCSWKQL